jgi:hypothetical protein
VATDYAADTSQWQEWQRAYRFGVLLILPHDPPAKEVNDLRSVYDPIGQSICEAHISLTVPLPRPVNDEHLRELRSIASTIEPFSIHYGPLTNYLPNPGVVLAIEPEDRLERLVTTLERASVFEGAPARSWPFSPHMTITEFISVERTKELMVELQGLTPEGDFLCNNISYAVPDGDFHFTERAKLELAR